jgi:hypothetical protein
MLYIIKALILTAQGARYGRSGLIVTLLMIVRGQCRLHWLRSSLEGGAA